MELFNDFFEPSGALPVHARASVTSSSGVTWIGLLYFFNFVQVPAYAELSDGARSEALRKLTFRALWWFRYAALLTVPVRASSSSGSTAREDGLELPRRRQRHRRSSPACSSASRCSSTCGA